MEVEMTELQQYELIRIKIDRIGIIRPKIAEILDIDINRLNNYLYGRINLDSTTLRYLSGFLDTIESIESLYCRTTDKINNKTKEN